MVTAETRVWKIQVRGISDGVSEAAKPTVAATHPSRDHRDDRQ
jgi:hypothetical protein